MSRKLFNAITECISYLAPIAIERTTSSFINFNFWDSRTVPASIRLSGIVLFVFPIFMSCSSKPALTQTQISENYLKVYRQFADSVALCPSMNTQSISKVIQRWSSFEEALFYSMSKDSLCQSNVDFIVEMAAYGHMINEKVISSINDTIYDFKDLLELEESVSCPGRLLMDIQSARTFYSEIKPDPALSSLFVEDQYIAFLDSSLQTTFSEWEDIEDFLRREDQFFECYQKDILSHPISTTEEIAIKTADVFEHINETSWNDNISKKLRDYTVVRTNRRLVTASIHSMESIIFHEVIEDFEARIALSNILHPFVYFNPIVIANRSEHEKESLKYIGATIPKALETLEEDEIEIDSLPDSLANNIMKEFITSIMNR